jgi:hypothetical protein
MRAAKTRAGRWHAVALVAALLASASASEVGVVGSALQPPTSPRYGTWGWYDLTSVAWTGAMGEAAGELRVTFGAVDASGAGALGLLQPVVEVYLLGGTGSVTLPGADLAFPTGTGWSRAIRISGEGAWTWSDDGGLEPLAASLDGATVRVVWPYPLPAGARYLAISGVFDPFSASGWRPIAREPSPWAFSNAAGGPPVVDVWPSDARAWAQLQEGRLPIPGRGVAAPWGRGASVVSMLSGLLIAAVGVMLRGRAGRFRYVRRAGAARVRRAARGG